MAKSTSPFLISESIQYGWNRTKERFGFFALVLIGSMIVTRLPMMLADEGGAASLILVLIGMVLSFVVGRGIIKISIEEARGKKSTINVFKASAEEYLNYFLVSLVYSLIVMVGFILLIIPGIIWSIKYQYMMYLVIDKKMGVSEAMRTSAAMTDGVKWELFALEFVLGIINFLGFLALVVGLLMTVPASAVAQARVYDRLLAKVK